MGVVLILLIVLPGHLIGLQLAKPDRGALDRVFSSLR